VFSERNKATRTFLLKKGDTDMTDLLARPWDAWGNLLEEDTSTVLNATFGSASCADSFYKECQRIFQLNVPCAKEK
jgi:hypothetical protein